MPAGVFKLPDPENVWSHGHCYLEFCFTLRADDILRHRSMCLLFSKLEEYIIGVNLEIKKLRLHLKL
jgi:hypothetical protein